MPELPEVETVRRSLTEKVTGLTITAVTVFHPQVAKAGVFADFAEALVGRRFQAFERRGKYLIARLDQGISLVVHLRMTGRWVYCAASEPVLKHTHVIFLLSNGHELRFRDVRRFGGLEIVKESELGEHRGLLKLGVEPLSEDFTAQRLEALVRGKKTKIKALILDQTRLAGLGNIYADEALFLAGVHPDRRAETLNRQEIEKLHVSIRTVLQEGINNKGTSFRDYVDGEGRQGQNQLSLKVYGRGGKACVNCGSSLGTMKIGGRTSVFCPNCQNP